jgi:hypothetical protein
VQGKEGLREIAPAPGERPTFWEPTCRGRFLLLRNRDPVELWDLESSAAVLRETDAELEFWPQPTR